MSVFAALILSTLATVYVEPPPLHVLIGPGQGLEGLVQHQPKLEQRVEGHGIDCVAEDFVAAPRIRSRACTPEEIRHYDTFAERTRGIVPEENPAASPRRKKTRECHDETGLVYMTSWSCGTSTDRVTFVHRCDVEEPPRGDSSRDPVSLTLELTHAGRTTRAQVQVSCAPPSPPATRAP